MGFTLPIPVTATAHGQSASAVFASSLGVTHGTPCASQPKALERKGVQGGGVLGPSPTELAVGAALVGIGQQQDGCGCPSAGSR